MRMTRCSFGYNFRAKSREEQANSIPDILKSYQDEIDQLSRRAKASEASFFALYKALYDGPDPAPIIEHLLASQTQVSYVFTLLNL